tara:strand:- start:979 stop:1779 length:801 start_codon:yes stop_codon:yes gene_type:complete
MQKLALKRNETENNYLIKNKKIIYLLIITIFFTIFGYKLIDNKNLEISKKIEKFFLLSFFTSQFKIEKIQISGIENIKERTILKSLNIEQGSSIYKIDLKNMHKNLKNINFVSKATIERKFNNTLKINIIEKKPVGILQKNNNYKIIASDGSLIDVQDIYEFSHLPIFIGKNVEKKVNEILSLLDETGFKKFIWSVTLINERRWNLNLKNGITILLPEKQFSLSLKKINNLNKKHNFLASNLVEIDLRDKNKIIFQPLIKPLNIVQ